MQHSPYLKDRPRRSPEQALAEMEDRRIADRLLAYAGLAMFHDKRPSEIQAELRAIAGQPHSWSRSMKAIGRDECLLCGRGEADPIHGLQTHEGSVTSDDRNSR